MNPSSNKTAKRLLFRIFVGIFLLVLYVVTAVPVGMFLYTLKSDIGWNVFQKTGYHGFLQCLQAEAAKID